MTTVEGRVLLCGKGNGRTVWSGVDLNETDAFSTLARETERERWVGNLHNSVVD